MFYFHNQVFKIPAPQDSAAFASDVLDSSVGTPFSRNARLSFNDIITIVDEVFTTDSTLNLTSTEIRSNQLLLCTRYKNDAGKES